MTLLEMQILFHQIIEDTSPEFFDKQRPDSYNVVNYLNQASMRFMDRYVSLPTMKENVRLISENSNDLKDMIRKVGTSNFGVSGGTYYEIGDGLQIYTPASGEDHLGPFGPNVRIYKLPDDFFHYISCYIKSSRIGSDIMTTTSQIWQECELVSSDQAGRYVYTDINMPIMRKPVILFDADNFVRIINPPDQSTLVYEIEFTYLRKPHTLDFDFEWLDAGAGTVLTSAMINKQVRVRDGSLMRYPDSIQPTNGYKSGDKFRVLNGYYNTYSYSVYHGRWLGYPGNSTDELSIAGRLHEDIVRLAVQMLLDEAKFKLAQKAEA
jgi:hypothetical protein